jgi:ATP synthase I chain
MRLCLLAVAASGTTFAVGAWAVFGARSALSVALGSGIATANLWVLGRIVAALLPVESAGARAQSRAGWVLVATLKMVGLVGVLWLLMRHGGVSPLSLMAGFGALPIGIAIGSLVSDRSAPTEPEP